MPGLGFDTLALLGGRRHGRSPARVDPAFACACVIGELFIGIVLGRTGFGLIDYTNPTLVMLANVGFALVMFVVGTHVPVHDNSLRSEMPWALARAVLVGAVAAGLGIGVAAIFSTGHAALYARADGVVVSCPDTARHRRAQADGSCGLVGDCTDRNRGHRLYRAAALGH